MANSIARTSMHAGRMKVINKRMESYHNKNTHDGDINKCDSTKVANRAISQWYFSKVTSMQIKNILQSINLTSVPLANVHI